MSENSETPSHRYFSSYLINTSDSNRATNRYSYKYHCMKREIFLSLYVIYYDRSLEKIV